MSLAAARVNLGLGGKGSVIHNWPRPNWPETVLVRLLLGSATPATRSETGFESPSGRSTETWSSFHPDFVFFFRKADGSLAASLIEPH